MTSNAKAKAKRHIKPTLVTDDNDVDLPSSSRVRESSSPSHSSFSSSSRSASSSSTQPPLPLSRNHSSRTNITTTSSSGSSSSVSDSISRSMSSSPAPFSSTVVDKIEWPMEYRAAPEMNGETADSKLPTRWNGCDNSKPTEFIHPSHPHPLRLINSNNILCGVCGSNNSRNVSQSYHCRRLCDFDVCMTCAMNFMPKNNSLFARDVEGSTPRLEDEEKEDVDEDQADDDEYEDEEKEIDQDIDLEMESDNDEDELDDNVGELDNKHSVTAPQTTAPKAPLVPFIFNPLPSGPSEAEREASNRAVQNRLKQFLDGTASIGKTSHVQRVHMSKDRLLQRNIEIQASQFYFDRDYDRLLTEKPTGWEEAVATLDCANDELADESDEIETLLFEKFRVVGGGRSLLSDEVRAAGEEGAAMADRHRQRGMPIPQLTIQTQEQTNGAAAAASSSTSAEAAPTPVAESLTSKLLITAENATPQSDVPAAASNITPQLSYPSTSKSDAAVKERLDAAQEATRIRRAARAQQAKESVLGKYMEYFNKFVDVERVPISSPNRSVAQQKKASIPASFPLLLGTLVFPLFSDFSEIKTNETATAEEEKHAEVAITASPAPASSVSPSVSRGTKRRRNSRDEQEEKKTESPDDEDSRQDESAEGQEDDSEDEEEEEEDDDTAGEDCWLDFTFDPLYHDGCVVKQTVESSNALAGESNDRVIGLLPFEGLHPPQPEEPEPEYDEDGELIPRKPLPRPMPSPSHALPAVYILHEADVIRLESVLVRTQEPSEDTRDRVEVTILVNSKIYEKQLLRSTAQKQALLTLFRLFSRDDPSEAIAPKIERSTSVTLPKPLYENSNGEMVEYSALTEAERRVIALKKTPEELLDEENRADSSFRSQAKAAKETEMTSDSPTADLEQRIVVKQEPIDASAPVPMDIDEDQKPASRAASKSGTSPSAAASGASTVSNGNKRRKVEPSPSPPSSLLSLSLVDQTIEGEEVGESESGEEEEMEDEEDEEDDSEEESELLETLDENHHVFVDLFLPTSEFDDENMETAVKEEPLEGTESNAVAVEPTVVTEEEKSMLRQLERNAEALEQKEPVGSSATSSKRELSSEEKAEAQQLEAENTAEWKPDSLHSLFESIRPTPKWTKSISQPAGLISTLRPFQAKALAWMVDRESKADERVYADPLWEQVKLNGRNVYYHVISGILQKQPPEELKDVRGGILADEMGLGKTLVAIALVLKQPWVQRPIETRKRSLCFTESGQLFFSSLYDAEPRRRPIRATLIVSPQSLVYQWDKEIRLHAPSLRVLIYDGSNAGKSSSSGYSATDRSYRAFRETMDRFAEYDIILTNYSVLAQEVNYSKSCSYQFRQRKQYGVPKSALLDCEFHRVILDEAQQVHSSLSVCFKMASRLSAQSKFCVSGTPIGVQGLHDLFGLVSFLGVAPYESIATWRAAMRTSTPEGMERLRALLKRIMWRHSKQHVLDEVCIPRLHLNKLFLTFSKIEGEYYKRLEYECSSHVFFEGARGRLEDRTAMKKLEALRIACAHPQASSGTFLGKQVKSMAEIGRALIKRVMDEQTVCERDLCRAINRLALEYHRQGEAVLAETTFLKSWAISDKGVSADLKDRSANPTSTSAAPAEKPANADESFETDVNIVTANSQVRQWRVIDLVTTFHLAKIYAHKLDSEFHRKVDERICTWLDSVEEVFDSIMQEAKKFVNLYASFPDTASAQNAAVEAMDKSTKPVTTISTAQGASALSAAARGSAPAGANTNSDASTAPSTGEEELTYVKYLRQRDQFSVCLHDLLDSHEREVNRAAVLNFITYEIDLLPKWVESCAPEVRELYDQRMHMGVESFNRDPKQIERIEELMLLMNEELELQEVVLTLYDLERSRNHINILLDKLLDNDRQLMLKNVHMQLRAVVKKKKHSYYPQAPPKPIVHKNGKEKSFEERLRKQLGLIQGAITKRHKMLPSEVREQLKEEDDMDYMENDQRNYHDGYDVAWRRARDSVAALKIMTQVKHDRVLLRVRIKKMLEAKIKLLLDQGIITVEDADQAAQRQMLQPQDAEEAEAAERKNQKASPKKKPSKKKAGVDADEEMEITDEDMAAVSAAAASAAAASGSSGSLNGIDSSLHPQVAAAAAARSRMASSGIDPADEVAMSRDLMYEGAIRKYQREIARLQTHAQSIQANVNWLKTQFGLMSANDSSFRGLPCSICSNEVSIPALTVCGHYYDYPCLKRWLQTSESCPTCRKQLGPDDYAAFNKEELPKPKQYELDSDPISIDDDEEMKNDSGNVAAASASALGRSLSLTATAPASSASVSASAPIQVPSLDVLLRSAIIGEGKYGSKVETIVKYIRYLHAKDPTIKVLVFSQYHRMLDMVHEALKENNLSSLHLTGTPLQRAKQIDQFQTDATFTAFLMSMRNDNSGLTLVSATAVFLMEPSLNSALEAQAINRICRIGQTKETQAFKFIMRNSVEQAIEELNAADRGNELVATGGSALNAQSKESMSVNQLLKVLNLSDDRKLVDEDEEEEGENAQPNQLSS